MSTPINPVNFLSLKSTSRGTQRDQTALWNYVATVRKATTVTRSCVGCFTGPGQLNLIVCKGSTIEIYVMIQHELQLIMDFPLVEKVVFMELSSTPPVTPATTDFLFIATELYKFCVFRWDANTLQLITTYTMRYKPPRVDGQLNYCQGGAVCPLSSIVVLYSTRDRLRIISNVDFKKWDSSAWRLSSISRILDVKFLYGGKAPMFVVLAERDGGQFDVEVYNVLGKQQKWQSPGVIRLATLLIPVHQDPYGFIVIGEKSFVYVSEQKIKTKPMGDFNIKAYGKYLTETQKHSYLLGDHDGSLHVIELPELTHRMLGRISVPSSVSYLRDSVVFVGSCSTDSQLIKIHHVADLQVLKTYANLGPISDFCLINKPGGRRKMVMCCGIHGKSFLEVFHTGTGINPKETIKISKVLNVWSLKSSLVGVFHTHLIVQFLDYFISVYIVDERGCRVQKMDGFISGPVTLCCHDFSSGHFIQVTQDSVRLIDSKTGRLKDKWEPGYKINCASANRSQILLASGARLAYLEMRQGALYEHEQRLQLDFDVACIDISPFEETLLPSKLAAVGTYIDNKVRVFSLPDLTFVMEEQLSCLPRCILLCAFGVERYLLCSVGDGTLFSFQLNEETSQLQDKNSVSLGSSSKKLRKISSNGEVYVLLITNAVPTVIFYKNKKLQYEALNLPDVADACHFHCEMRPESVVMATEDGCLFCTLGEIAEPGKIEIASYARHICHHKKGQSYAIIVEQKQQRKSNHILLLDKNLNTQSAFNLLAHEVGVSIISCQFTGDKVTYYCVGTAFEDNPAKGRILVLFAGNGTLMTIAQQQAYGAVHYLKELHGGLLVNDSHDTPRFFEWVIYGHQQQKRKLLEKPNSLELGGVEERFSCLYSASRKVKYELGDIIVAPENRTKHTAVQMMRNGDLFSSDACYILRSHSGVNMEATGQWYSGAFITQIRAGTLSRLSDEHYAQVPSSIFSTENGAIGVIVSLPSEVYLYLEELEKEMRTARKSVNDSIMFTHECIGLENAKAKHFIAKHFIDGDFLGSFLALPTEQQKKIAGEMNVDFAALNNILEYLALFHGRLKHSGSCAC